MPQLISDFQTEWVKVLNKGLVTLPKNFRDTVGIREGDVAKITKIGRRLVIQSRESADYEVYGRQEFTEMLADDKLPRTLAKKTTKIWPELK
ncbi:AbrB/MazE/SpoVT family DNA-binding domain-containing protein [Patescibacteria group bacterium]|nr:AbrB/MazE/SpoVT family DNA-binding domain-containing protein [Patescibacteria group bacterium]MBU1499452.1 AbrB/MazE/SpoVT family DNA-binding domain-containing protein [Patescibacteria group bacterium]